MLLINNKLIAESGDLFTNTYGNLNLNKKTIQQFYLRLNALIPLLYKDRTLSYLMIT